MHGRLLVLAEELAVAQSAGEFLRGLGYLVVETADVKLALAAVNGGEFDAILANLPSKREARVKLVDGLHQTSTKTATPLLLLNACDSAASFAEALKAGAFDVIAPSRPSSLVRATTDARHSAFSQLVGQSDAVMLLRGLIDRVAAAASSVLITGESGTGKEVVAKVLHALSPRAGKRFVAVNCGAIPATLFESELFGHVKGAFTDARTDRLGAFREAHEGTLFLDEVGELPVELQSKLLRALQERKVRPVGADTEVAIDVRIIAATNRDLKQAVTERRFREDLYFRLNVVHLDVPPLRARGDDVLVLAHHFLAQSSARLAKRVDGLAEDARQALVKHRWPGNVRELQNAIERAVVVCPGKFVTAGDLPPSTTSEPTAAEQAAVPLKSLEEVERLHVLAVIEASGGNFTRAARSLGIDRATLYRKLKSWQLAPHQ